MSPLNLTLEVLAAACASQPSLKAVTFADIERFWRYTERLIPEVRLSNGRDTFPPRLPLYIHEFLRQCLSLRDRQVVALWEVLGKDLWKSASAKTAEGLDGTGLMHEERAIFEIAGGQGDRDEEKLSHTIFYPPRFNCSKCGERLKKHSRYPVTAYTLRYGACRAYASSLFCTQCKIRYYHNYYCVDGLRIYYNREIPSFIHFEEHAFIESSVCEFFTSLMLHAWVSGSNCAHIYNASLSNSDLKIRTKQVWAAFYLNALLRDKADHSNFLTLLDAGSNEARLQTAMELRNLQMVRDGQPMLMHACNKCEKMVPGGTGYNGYRALRAVVVDGVLVPFPCCREHNCSIPLANHRDRYCPIHMARTKSCVFPECAATVEVAFQTCTNPEHRKAELSLHQQKKAFFQLKARLKQSNVSQITDSMALEESQSDEIDDHDYTRINPTFPEHKSDKGEQKRGALFGRRRTHNEELIVCCCGVIAARATMYGAEAISGVKDLLKSTYRHNPMNLPDVIFFDNNCQLQEHLQKQSDSFFKHAILAVDVFHFDKKHSQKDEFCQKHCNPASWPELYDEHGNWVFNSSAAEQANAWIGGYLSITRDMLAYRFAFFLDEMIKRRNEKVVQRLEEQNEAPYIVPFSDTTC